MSRENRETLVSREEAINLYSHIMGYDKTVQELLQDPTVMTLHEADPMLTPIASHLELKEMVETFQASEEKELLIPAHLDPYLTFLSDRFLRNTMIDALKDVIAEVVAPKPIAPKKQVQSTFEDLMNNLRSPKNPTVH